METVEDLADEVLLVGVEDVADGFGADVPIVVDFETERVVVGEAEGGGLGFVKAFVELLDESLRGGGWSCDGLSADETAQGGSALSDELAAVGDLHGDAIEASWGLFGKQNQLGGQVCTGGVLGEEGGCHALASALPSWVGSERKRDSKLATRSRMIAK